MSGLFEASFTRQLAHVVLVVEAAERGALQWHTSLAEGLAAARAERKKVFIGFGRAA